MKSDVYWVESGARGRIATMARPRAGDWLEDEVEAWRGVGVHTVVSLLTRAEVDELGLGGEQRACEARGLEFHSFEIVDRSVPALDGRTNALIRDLAAQVSAGRSVAIHCRAGIGRSSLIAAATMVVLGVAPGDALARISAARRMTVPDTEEQRQWVLQFRP